MFQNFGHFLKRRIPEENGEGIARKVEPSTSPVGASTKTKEVNCQACAFVFLHMTQVKAPHEMSARFTEADPFFSFWLANASPEPPQVQSPYQPQARSGGRIVQGPEVGVSPLATPE